jgi:hypothetical protein
VRERLRVEGATFVSIEFFEQKGWEKGKGMGVKDGGEKEYPGRVGAFVAVKFRGAVRRLGS